MTNAELADALNSELGLAGRCAVTVNVIRQWVGWGVLERADAAGRRIGLSPEWRRDERTLKRARYLAELRRAGVRRETAYVAHAYIEWRVGGFERVKSAIKAEFGHARAQLMRRVTSETSFVSFAALSTTRKRALRHQAGPIDKRWAGSSFEQSPELYATALNAIRSGRIDPERLSLLLSIAAEQIVPSFAHFLSTETGNVLIGSLPGLFGSPDEIGNSAEEVIERASERDFRTARIEVLKRVRAFHVASSIMDQPKLSSDVQRLFAELNRVAPEIRNGSWLVSGFVACLNFQSKTIGNFQQHQG